MVKAGIIGLGKMGLSHYAIFNVHKDVNVVTVCDPSNLILKVIEKNNGVKGYKDYKKMIDECELDCVIVATPTKFHTEIVRYALMRDLHVFCEKPFCLNVKDGYKLIELAKEKNSVNQVGYHCRFTGVFQKTKEFLEQGIIGDAYYFIMEVYGNVVKKKQGITWRAKKSEGGGCLYDYASHGVDLINYLIGFPITVSGTVLKKIKSTTTEDAVYSTLLYENGISGQLAVNWCDPTYRKMANQITIMGTNGKVIANRQECKLFIQNNAACKYLEKGWNIFYTTDVTRPVDFYLRGEEYSAQVDYFIQCIKSNQTDNISSFENAIQTDTLIELLASDGRRMS